MGNLPQPDAGSTMSPILFICSAKGSYTRNDVIRGMLRKMSPEYVEIVSEKNSYPMRLLEVVSRWLLGRARGSIVFLGFLAQPLVPVAVLLRARPLAVDFFISLYDTLCLDRCVFTPGGPVGLFLKAFDRWCLRRANLLLTDTEDHADFLAETFGVARERFTVIPVSANPEIFKPMPRAPRSPEKIRVVFHATFLPLHGAEIVYAAARLLGTESHIEIEIIGTGRTSEALDRRLDEWKLENVRRIPWIEYQQLGAALAEADICLGGHFSDNPKAGRVIPGKVYQYLAVARPVILGDTPANRRVFTHLQNAYFCETGSADDLARAIWELSNDRSLRERIARNGYILFQEKFHPDVLAEELAKALSADGANPVEPCTQ
jgi:glycosyltransferase involved in cell wall biosynthesis